MTKTLPGEGPPSQVTRVEGAEKKSRKKKEESVKKKKK